MESFKLWAISLSGALAVTSIFRILINKSSLYKSINIFLSMLIFLYTIIPLENIIDNIDFTSSIENRNESYSEYYKIGYEKIVIKTIKNICDENNVSVISFNMNSYIDDNGYLNVENIEIEIDSPEKKTEIIKKINEITGFEVNVI